MNTVRTRLQTALRAAMKERDTVAMSALRSALGAIANAEAVPVASGPRPAADPSKAAPTPNVPIAGGVAGLRAAEVARRAVTDDEAAAIAAAEAAGRREAAVDYRAAGRADRADRLVREAEVIESALERAAPGDDA